MSLFQKDTTLQINDFVALIESSVCEKDLPRVLGAICNSWNLLRISKEVSSQNVFSELSRLAKSSANTIESELFKKNIPVQYGKDVSSEQLHWVTVSSIIFKLNPVLSPGFCKSVVEGCLTRQTNVAFALSHSAAIASLVKRHADVLNPSLIEMIIMSADDSRSIYALRFVRWLPNWAEVREVALNAMTSGSMPKRVEAMWLVNERSTVDELISFMEAKGIANILGSSSEGIDIKDLTKIVVSSTGKTPEYAIISSGRRLSQSGEVSILKIIRRVIFGDKFN